MALELKKVNEENMEGIICRIFDELKEHKLDWYREVK